MGYRVIGGAPADYIANSAGAPTPNATLWVWTARTGGTRITDTKTITGAATDVVTSDSTGGYIHQVNDILNGGSVEFPVWLEAARGGKRYAAMPIDLATLLTALSTAAVRSINGTGPNAAGNVTVTTSGGTVDQTARDSAASAVTVANTASSAAQAAQATANRADAAADAAAAAAAAAAQKAATPGVRTRTAAAEAAPTATNWSARPTGHPVVMAIGALPTPSDAAATDLHLIPQG